MENNLNGNAAKSPAKNFALAFVFASIGLVICAAGIYVGETDDAPGAGVGGIVLMTGMMVLAVKTARRKTTK